MRSMQSMRYLAIVLLLVTVACGGAQSPNPTAPTPTPSPLPAPAPVAIAGVWSGGFSFQYDGQTYTHAATLTLTQADTRVTGTLTTNQQWTGTLDGFLNQLTGDAIFTGRLRLDVPGGGGVRCLATVENFIGPVTPTVVIHGTDPTTFVNCGSTIRDVRLALRR